jgi:hypothetical protein
LTIETSERMLFSVTILRPWNSASASSKPTEIFSDGFWSMGKNEFWPLMRTPMGPMVRPA